MWQSFSVVTAGPRGSRCSLDGSVVQRLIYKKKRQARGRRAKAGGLGARRVYCKRIYTKTDALACIAAVQYILEL